jgi:hypothetical protein
MGAESIHAAETILLCMGLFSIFLMAGYRIARLVLERKRRSHSN